MSSDYQSLICGETEIRTPDTLLEYTRFPGVPLKPLEHLSRLIPKNRDCKDRNFFLFCKKRFFYFAQNDKLLCQAAVHELFQGGLVQVLADKHDLLHAVAILGIPIGPELAVAFHHFLQFVFGHGGEP